MTQTILVTGGAGYIGSHACKQLATAGYEPITYDDLSRGHRELVKWGPLEQGDILDKDRLTVVLKHYRPAAVMHFAALAYVKESVEQPELYERVNVQGSLSLLHAMTEAKTARLVFSSTCSTYGEPQEIPITEAHPQNPVNPYGQTKLTMEKNIGQWVKDTHGESVIFRYFNAAGADPKGETGEWHEPETHLIPLALMAVAGETEQLTVFGDDYDTPDGTCVRDYVHVTDLADAHVQGLSYSTGKGASNAFNLGNGHGFSVNEVIAVTEKVTGKPVPREYGLRREGDPPCLVGDARLARDLLGWAPERDSLDQIIQSAWNWYRR